MEQRKCKTLLFMPVITFFLSLKFNGSYFHEIQENEAKKKDIVSQRRCNAGVCSGWCAGGHSTPNQVPQLWKVGSQKE
jgi:hypothetical protein